jgi:hypothetical protein
MSEITTSVYRYYDARGALLYVGITSRGLQRNYEHNHIQEWWPFAVRQDIEHFGSRDEAAKRERQLIQEFRPPFNKQHNVDYGAFRDAYLMSFVPGTTQPIIPMKQLELNAAWREVPMTVTGQMPGRVLLTTDPAYLEVVSRIMWADSESRITMDGLVIGALERTLINDCGLTMQFEIAEEVVDVASAEMRLKRKGGKHFVMTHIAIKGERDSITEQRNRSAGNSIAKRYPLKKAMKSPQSVATTKRKSEKGAA